MTEPQKTTHTPLSADSLPTLAPPAPPTTKQLAHDCGYYKAQLLLQSMLDSGIISLSEFNKITLLNRQTFSPYLAEIMPEMTG